MFFMTETLSKSRLYDHNSFFIIYIYNFGFNKWIGFRKRGQYKGKYGRVYVVRENICLINFVNLMQLLAMHAIQSVTHVFFTSNHLRVCRAWLWFVSFLKCTGGL